MSAPFFVLPPLLPLWKHQRQFRNLVKDLPCDYELNMRGLCIKDIGDLRFKYVLKEYDFAEYNGPLKLDTELRQIKTLNFVVEYGKDITQKVHA